MNISHLIETLADIKIKFGDLPILGGCVNERDTQLRISVLNAAGVNLYPETKNHPDTDQQPACIFIEGR